MKRLAGLCVALVLACRGEDARDRLAVDTGTVPVAVVADTAGVLPRCESVDALLRRIPGLTVRRPDLTTLAAAWSGAAARPACQVRASGHFVGRFGSVDSLFAWLRASGWRDNTIYSADGPDGTVAGMHRAGVTCVLDGHWDGGDDSDSTYVPSDTLDIVGTCAATLPIDTTLPVGW